VDEPGTGLCGIGSVEHVGPATRGLLNYRFLVCVREIDMCRCDALTDLMEVMDIAIHGWLVC
jgi:hypothetical protein